jgi:hypothetical protein
MTAVIAEVRFSHPRMHLYHTLSSLEEVVLRPDLPLHTESDRPTVFMTVEIEPTVDWETVERALSEDETVRDASVMTDSGAMRIYRIDFDQSSIEDFPTKATDRGSTSWSCGTTAPPGPPDCAPSIGRISRSSGATVRRSERSCRSTVSTCPAPPR